MEAFIVSIDHHSTRISKCLPLSWPLIRASLPISYDYVSVGKCNIHTGKDLT